MLKRNWYFVGWCVKIHVVLISTPKQLPSQMTVSNFAIFDVLFKKTTLNICNVPRCSFCTKFSLLYAPHLALTKKSSRCVLHVSVSSFENMAVHSLYKHAFVVKKKKACTLCLVSYCAQHLAAGWSWLFQLLNALPVKAGLYCRDCETGGEQERYRNQSIAARGASMFCVSLC